MINIDNAIKSLSKFYLGKLTPSDIDDAILALGGIPQDIYDIKTCITCEHYFRGLNIHIGGTYLSHSPDYCERETYTVPKFDVIRGITYNKQEGTTLYCDDERNTGKCGLSGNFWTPKITNKLMW